MTKLKIDRWIGSAVYAVLIGVLCNAAPKQEVVDSYAHITQPPNEASTPVIELDPTETTNYVYPHYNWHCHESVPVSPSVWLKITQYVGLGFGLIALFVGYRLWHVGIAASVFGHISLIVFTILSQEAHQLKRTTGFYISIGVGTFLAFISLIFRKRLTHIHVLSLSWVIYGMMLFAPLSHWQMKQLGDVPLYGILISLVVMLSVCFYLNSRIMIIMSNCFVGCFAVISSVESITSNEVLGIQFFSSLAHVFPVDCWLGLPNIPDEHLYASRDTTWRMLVIWILGSLAFVGFQISWTARGFHHNKKLNRPLPENIYDDTPEVGNPASINGDAPLHWATTPRPGPQPPSQHRNLQDTVTWVPAWATQQPPAYED
eukprot:m.337189 g.337189  ORF g.337189 m.337189 type:complete len:373 (+) comp18071_c0_seq1:161-1279(+)